MELFGLTSVIKYAKRVICVVVSAFERGTGGCFLSIFGA